MGSAGILSDTSLVEKKEWSAGIGVRLPLFEGFRLTATEQKLGKVWKESQFILAEIERSIMREVRNALTTMNGLENKRKHLEEQARLVKDAYRLARERYFNKTGAFADLRDAQKSFFQITEQVLTTQYDERFAIDRLRIVTGHNQ